MQHVLSALQALQTYPGLINYDLLGVWVGAILTLMVFSYLLGDNFLYQIAQHLFVGSTVGYAAVVAYHSVLQPQLMTPLAVSLQDVLAGRSAANWDLVILLVLGILLLTKVRPSIAWAGNVAMAFLFGVGAALAVGGALSGTLVPQVEASLVSLNPERPGGWLAAANNALIVVGTLSVLLYFTFTASRESWLAKARTALIRPWAGLGRWFLMITFGALFANVAVSRIALLVSRLQFLLFDWLQVR